MVFTSPVFLGVFLPLLFAVYFLANRAARPYVLLVFSILFYAWGEPIAVMVMLALMVINYFLALAASSRLVLSVAIAVNLGALIAYKYLGFFTGGLVKIALPIGISFYVFQIISYLVDVHRREVPAQRNPFAFMLYVSLFPQLIAGPIVRYSTIAEDIANRTANFENIVAGLRRFAIGLAKKVLIADAMATAVDAIFAAPANTIPCAWCWIGAIAYTLQIYFDFSGYSDMAIGLGRVFNFRFLENFDHPYCARSIREFWRRWHISLSTWFRDYLYIPLGGSRCGTIRTYFNLFIVFLLCGLWHGAAWNFVVWGLYHGLGLVIERIFGSRRSSSIFRGTFGNAYVMLFVIVGWVIFRSPDLSYAGTYLANMFGFATESFRSFTPSHEFIALDKFLLMLVGIACSYPLFEPIARKVPEALRIISGMLFFAFVFILAITSSYSPFIYFRF